MPGTVQEGSYGDDVERVQRVLARLGLLDPVVDGWFGPETDAAVRAFQTSAGLTVDGIVGDETWSALPAYREASPILQEGWTGPVVRILQDLLQRSGLYAGALDGIFGPEMVESVRSYQRLIQVADDGVVTDETWLWPRGAGGRSLEALAGLAFT